MIRNPACCAPPGRRCGTQLCNKHRCSSGHLFTAFLLTKHACGRRPGTGPGEAAAARPARPAAGPSAPGRGPRQPAVPCRTRGTPASRRPGQLPWHRRPGTAARQQALPGHGRLGHAPSVPGAGRPAQGRFVLQHAPSAPGTQPGSANPSDTGTMTAASRTRHARCQPRSAPTTLIATVTPSTPARDRRPPWTSSDGGTPAPQGHPQRRGTHLR